MELVIAGKTALVCGASKGLGYGCAEALVKEGVNVLIVARGEADLQAASARLHTVATQGAWVKYVAADITTEAGRAAVFAAQPEFDIVVTNAGGPPPGDFRAWDKEAWFKAVEANMYTPIALIQATVDGMAARGFGRIINITSSAVKAPIDVLGLSNGARSGLTGFVAGVARSGIAAQGVTINNILPGLFDTDRLRGITENAMQKSGKSKEQVQAAQQHTIPVRRFGQPHEFGALCAFLCSDLAGYITGQNLLIDGGAYAGTF
ncbi:SDR family oxidoreductase [Vitreoscilla massiliensis]|uniref:SDR family oxidoreductase n=1 Tax=Vitreoscilla massiliensis TaxID=1689272 RepID=A0ABY4E352_9NEIS|nr:SDR family oxidoreductase [Vitreoscilla massiliensis]UOO90196.1 SDR family oxidoreductase [Vitreoscilla massiliensis]